MPRTDGRPPQGFNQLRPIHFARGFTGGNQNSHGAIVRERAAILGRRSQEIGGEPENRRVARLLLKLWEQETGVAAMVPEGFSELHRQHGFLFPRFDPIAEDDQGHTGDASPAVDRERSADCRQVDPGINRVPEIRVGAGANELVVFFESDSRAPILSQVPAGPESDRDASPGEGNAGNGKSVAARENLTTENADLPCVTEEQDETEYLEKKNAATRREGFPADGAPRLQCTREPVNDEYDPWTFNQITPDHLLSTVRRHEPVSLRKQGVKHTQRSVVRIRRDRGSPRRHFLILILQLIELVINPALGQ